MSTPIGAPAELGLTHAEEVAANLAAMKAFIVHAQLELMLAFVEGVAVDPHRVFEVNRHFADGWRRQAKTSSGKLAARTTNLAADLLEELETLFWHSVGAPPGAGHA